MYLSLRKAYLPTKAIPTKATEVLLKAAVIGQALPLLIGRPIEADPCVIVISRRANWRGGLLLEEIAEIASQSRGTGSCLRER